MPVLKCVKREKFAQGVALGKTQADAYREANPNCVERKWKDETIWKRASEWMADGEVAGRVDELRAGTAERNEITQDMVIQELAKIAFGDQRRVMEWGPAGVKLRDSKQITDDEAVIVAEVSETVTANGGTLKLKTHDKVGALKLLGDHLGMFKKQVELTGKDGAPIQMQAVDTSGLSVAEKRALLQLVEKMEAKSEA